MTSCPETALTVCEADLPIPVLCECASAVGKQFQGRWVVKHLRPLVCQGIEISAEQFLGEYDRVRHGDQLHLPIATAETIHFVTRRGVSEYAGVAFSEAGQSQTPGFGLCLRLTRSERQTVLNPFTIYSVPAAKRGVCVADHNCRAREAYLNGKEEDSVKSRIKEVLNASIDVVRRLLTFELNRKQAAME